jgi:hypothetical protein
VCDAPVDVSHGGANVVVALWTKLLVNTTVYLVQVKEEVGNGQHLKVAERT